MSVERAKQLVDALTEIEKWRTKPASVRKRRFTRFGIRGSGMLVEVSINANTERPHTTPVQLRDVSRGGVGFLLDRPLRVDCPYRLLFIEQELVIKSLPLFIRYCQQLEKNAYLLGGEFGAEAALLAALGVPIRDIATNDVPEDSLGAAASGDFVDPDEMEAA